MRFLKTLPSPRAKSLCKSRLFIRSDYTPFQALYFSATIKHIKRPDREGRARKAPDPDGFTFWSHFIHCLFCFQVWQCISRPHSIHPRLSRFPGPILQSIGRKKEKQQSRRTRTRSLDRIEGRRRTSNGRNDRTTETEERKHKSRNGKADNHSRPHQRKRKDKPAAPSHKRENKTPSPVYPTPRRSAKQENPVRKNPFLFLFYIFSLFPSGKRL